MSALPRFRYAFDPAALAPKPEPLPLPKETPFQRAQRYQAMLDTELVSNRAELARALGCSRAWVTKVLGRGLTGPAELGPPDPGAKGALATGNATQAV